MAAAIRGWDAVSYQRISVPHEEWAKAILERLPLDGDEIVLDAGCGTGRLARMLVERLPNGRVVAVDGSQAMVDKVADVLRPTDEAFVHDLTALDLPESVDAIASSAIFHWIPDHELLFRGLRSCLKEGGRLAAQCGGAANIDDFRTVSGGVAAGEAYASHLVGLEEPWYYAGAEETEARLRDAGFGEVRCWLQPWEVIPPDPVEFMRTLILAPHLDCLPENLNDHFLADVLEATGEPLRRATSASTSRPSRCGSP